jgi:hypothetical protein
MGLIIVYTLVFRHTVTKMKKHWQRSDFSKIECKDKLNFFLKVSSESSMNNKYR